MSVILNESSREPVVVTLGLVEPALFDTITFDGKAVDMTGATVVFSMRPLTSRAPVIDSVAAMALAPPDDDGHNVSYQWQITDVVIEGPYMGWWGYRISGYPMAETPEFPIIISDHGPGFGTSTGAVVDGIRGFMPITFEALRRHPTFGDRFLQKHADHVKRITMGAVVTADQEENYDPLLIEYLSKKTSLRLIAPAKDFWARQHRTVTTQGPSEMASYPDMLQALDQLEQRLKRELEDDWRTLNMLVPGLPQLRVEPMPASSLGTAAPITPDPQLTQRPSSGGPWWAPWFPS